MTDVFDALFSNLIILIQVVFIVFMRIINARRKPDSDKSEEPEERPAIGMGHWESGKRPQPAQSITRKNLQRPSTIASSLDKTIAEPPAPINTTGGSSHAIRGRTQIPLPASGISQCNFPQNLDYLPVLKKAIVLTEVLSPPVALRD